MKLRKLRAGMNLEGKRVLVRIDANVPIKNGRVIDGPHGRIARSAVGLDWLLQRGARVIVMTHLGRPGGRRVSAYSVKPVAKRLSGLLRFKVKRAKGITGGEVTRAVDSLKNGELLLLENLRFDKREKQNDPAFAEELAALGDIYVNDAFSVSHRAHASLSAITAFLPSYAGPLLVSETSTLAKLDESISHPFVLVMGGMKFDTKIPVMERFAKEVDQVLIGGALATTIFDMQGKEVGKSVHQDSAKSLAKELMDLLGEKIMLPTDVIAARSMRKDARFRVAEVDDVKKHERITDLGPESIATYRTVLREARTIVWNGPLGYCEILSFCKATEAIASTMAERTGKATTIVGGGDTGPILERLELADAFTLLSTGGGAMLAFLANQQLPGIEALKHS